MNAGTHVRIFLSHSHEDREVAAWIKEELARFRGHVFVAHEDINPTEDWQESIVRNLKECDVFLALLSENFAKSNWTDQETGIAFALDKIIVSLSMGVTPYGFIGKYQALKWDPEEPGMTLRELVRTLLDKKILTVDALIAGFSTSYSFEDAGMNAELLASDIKFTKEQIDTILRISMQNGQIRESFRARSPLSKLFGSYSGVIDPRQMKKWTGR